MILVKTNMPGFMKDPQTGVIHNMNEGAIRAAQDARRQWKIQKTMEKRIEELEERMRYLEAKAR